MRTFLAALVLFAAIAHAKQPPLTNFTADTGAPRSEEQKAVVFEAADLQLRVDPNRKSIDGDAALTFRAESPVNRLAVELDRNLRIQSIDVDGVAVPAGSWSNPDGRLFIPLAKPLAAGDKATVRIRYGGKPHVAKRAPWDGGFVWGKTPSGQPWIATAVEGEGCDLFWPCIDHPQGEPGRMDLHITVPAPLVAAENGVLIGMDEKNGWRTYHWRTHNPDTYAIALNIAPYELMSGEYKSRYGNTIPLRFYHLPGNKAKAQELFAELTPILDFFESTIGPYPFADEKVGIVETPHLGMEHQTINAYGNKYAKAPEGYDWLLQHEFSHEWFGNQLTNADWDDMWLHEGFGSYMQPLYLQYLYGDRMYYGTLHRLRAGIRNSAPLVSGKSKTGTDVYRAERGGPGQDIYSKGAYVRTRCAISSATMRSSARFAGSSTASTIRVPAISRRAMARRKSTRRSSMTSPAAITDGSSTRTSTAPRFRSCRPLAMRRDSRSPGKPRTTNRFRCPWRYASETVSRRCR